jgi:hypothetical protein
MSLLVLCDIIFTERLRILRNSLIILCQVPGGLLLFFIDRAASVGKSGCRSSSAVCKSKTAMEGEFVKDKMPIVIVWLRI